VTAARRSRPVIRMGVDASRAKAGGKKVSNSPPRVQSLARAFGRGVTYFTYICIPPPQIRPIAEGRGGVTSRVASLSWQATRAPGSPRCEIFNLLGPPSASRQGKMRSRGFREVQHRCSLCKNVRSRCALDRDAIDIAEAGEDPDSAIPVF
jgi:hypothetical protein